MRILHTADWHIGQTLAGYDRGHEHRAVLDEVARIAAERAVDAMIVAGDVFDHQNPSGESQRLFYEAIIALKRARPEMAIVITAGNHDAAGRLEAPRALLEPLGVHIVGNVHRRGGRLEAAGHLVPLRRKAEVLARVLAVSHPTAACLPPLSNLEMEAGASPIVAATRRLYAELAAATGALSGEVPLIVTGHLHVAGGLESEGAERRILVGGQHAVPPDVFPDAASYVALGHLHRAQAIGRPTIRYSGSLLPLSASELGYDHGVTLVTLSGDQVETEHIPVTRPVRFLRVPVKGEAPLSELGERLREIAPEADTPIEQRPFVQVWISREGLQPGVRAEIDRIAEALPVRLVEPRIARAGHEGGLEEETGQRRSLEEIRPEEMFERAFAAAHGLQPSPEHLAAFHEAAALAGRT